MAYSGEGVQALTYACNDLCNSNMLYADMKVQEIMKCISYYPEIRNVLKQCCDGFNYEIEKKKVFASIQDNYFFKQPRDERTLVAIVCNLFSDILLKKIDILPFSAMYFSSSSQEESFRLFCDNIIVPFKKAVSRFIIEGLERKIEIVNSEVELESGIVSQQISYLVVEIAKAIKEEEMQDAEREDFMILLDGFASALDHRDVLLIRACWLGLKLALQQKKLCEKEIVRVDEVLRMYLISK